MAIVLKDMQHTQQAVLARFQQRLGDPPSPLDILIINQIGCMLISNLVRRIRWIVLMRMISIVGRFSHKQCMKKLFDYLQKLFSIRLINLMIIIIL